MYFKGLKSKLLSISEVVVALIIFLIVLINAFFFFIFIAFLITVVFGLETTFLRVGAFRTESGLGLTHLVEFLCADVVVIFVDFLFLITSVLVF